MGPFFALFFSTAVFLLRIQGGQCADIIGGKESVPHSRPYMATIIQGKYLVCDKLSCGGTLIDRKWVLTAAHCFPSEDLQIVLGAHSLCRRERGKRIHGITQVFAYPGYNAKTVENDIMLLKLDKAAKVGKTVQFIRLPSMFEDVKAGTQCLVAGWGTTDNGELSETLREVNVTVVARTACNDLYQEEITENMLCAGEMNGSKDSDQGDSGGPLICDGEQRGIVSFGIKGYPGVYTRLTKDYIAWIKKTMEDNA
ncbi:granzyme A-like [Hemicordylus capensis]|uniref:granzyme A-like n=1 Tax=Hemicordylus capensis TaxID=884348 RepID=UPI002302046E|nr:granzyme A-like [Hemicordylus capensis]